MLGKKTANIHIVPTFHLQACGMRQRLCMTKLDSSQTYIYWLYKHMPRKYHKHKCEPSSVIFTLSITHTICIHYIVCGANGEVLLILTWQVLRFKGVEHRHLTFTTWAHKMMRLTSIEPFNKDKCYHDFCLLNIGWRPTSFKSYSCLGDYRIMLWW